MQSFKYVRPKSLAETISLLEHYGASASILCGGTDLTVGLRHGSSATDVIIDIKRVNDLPAKIEKTELGIDISATAVLSDIIQHEAVHRHFPALIEAAAFVGSVQIRNRATLVGNICNASPAADTVTVLAVLGAVLSISGPGGARSLPITEFILGNREISLSAGELVTSVHLPITRQQRGLAFTRITRRRGVDLATVNVCCGVDLAGVTTFGLGAVSPRPLLVRDVTGRLASPSISALESAEVIAALVSKASPITDIRASAEYRLAMLTVMGQRAHRSALERMQNWVDYD